MIKTNAMRLLEGEDISYNPLQYDIEDDKIDGISVANKIGKDLELVYKTLVAEGDIENYVFVIPVAEELDLKKAAKIVNEKKIALVNISSIEKLTGYIRGGCSPIGMKKDFPTYIQEDALLYDMIIVSAGRIGSQIEIGPKDLADYVKGEFVDIIK